MEKNMTGYPSIDKPWMKYYSEEAINAPLPECTMYEYLWQQNREHLGRKALRYFGNKITFRELFDNIEKAAKAFTAAGLKKGDIVVMATVTTPETVYSFYALNRLGVIPNMVDPRTSAEGIREYILEVNATFIIVIDAAYEKIKQAIIGTKVQQIVVTSPSDSLPLGKRILFTTANKLKGTITHYNDNSINWKQFMQAGENTPVVDIPYEKDRCCVIVHTGGTTGFPKGVMLSNDNVNALVFQSILTGIDMKREHTWMDIMPPFIAYGIGMGLHLPLVIGMETILIPTFDAKKFDRLLLQHKPVHMVGVPSYWGTIINSKRLRKESLSYLIAPTVGGDSMDVLLEQDANAFLKEHGCNYPITKGYGMTEVCAGVSGTVDANNEIGSVGVPFVKTTISVFDPDTGKELTYHQPGEICISGPNVMLGYYNNMDATNAIRRTHPDGTVWIHSGDMGYMTETGSIHIVDRMKRLIIRYDGFKVFPSLVEKVVSSHNAVAACCTIGIEDKEHSQGNLPFTYVILSPKSRADSEIIKQELIALCKKELPEYAQPVGFGFKEVLPLTSIGKIDYRQLEKEAEKARAN